MNEALLYDKLDHFLVQCHVCEHHCVIHESKRGICGVRENKGGILYALNDGITISCAVDPIEKKPLYHYLPFTKTYSLATVGCNMICPWCQNHDISQSSKPMKEIEGIEMSPEEHVSQAIKLQCPSISYTYSEPTIFLEYALKIMILAHANGLKNIWVSNGYMSDQTLDLILPYLDAVNIDFKGNQETYLKLCNGKMDVIERNLIRLYQSKVHVEITTLVIPSVNDSVEDFKYIAEFIVTRLSKDVPWYLSRFFPAWKMKSTKITPISTLMLAQKIGLEFQMTRIHLGNVW